jgi:hypothetical protein
MTRISAVSTRRSRACFPTELAFAPTRGDEAHLASGDVAIEEHDYVYIICSQEPVKKLRERYIDDRARGVARLERPAASTKR